MNGKPSCVSTSKYKYIAFFLKIPEQKSRSSTNVDRSRNKHIQINLSNNNPLLQRQQLLLLQVTVTCVHSGLYSQSSVGQTLQSVASWPTTTSATTTAAQTAATTTVTTTSDLRAFRPLLAVFDRPDFAVCGLMAYYYICYYYSC